MARVDHRLQVPIAEASPRDISAYRRGNTGVDYVHRIDSGLPGPSVAIAGLTHGNEICGMTAVTWLLDRAVRPRRGKLTLWLGNVAAYERLRADDLANQTKHRFVDRDLNRAWGDDVVRDDHSSIEAHRVRALLPFVEAQDALLDIHSTTFCETPFFVYRDLPRMRALADAIGVPSVQVLMAGGQHSGLTMGERGKFSDPAADARCVAVECGTHLSRAAGILAVQVALRFLDRLGVLDPQLAATHIAPAQPEPARRYLIDRVFRPATDTARFARPFAAFEELRRGEPIVVDGAETLVAPFDRCTVLMPSPVVTKGRDMVTLARPIDA